MTETVKQDQWKEWMQEFQSETDRGCALLGVAFVDSQLRALLEAFFVDDYKTIEPLFHGNGSLSSLYQKILMAYALGFLAPHEFRDLNLLRKIRNDFAHELHGLHFETPPIANRCTELRTCDDILSLSGIDYPRNRFVLTVVLLANWIALRRLGIRDSRREVHKGMKTGGPA